MATAPFRRSSLLKTRIRGLSPAPSSSRTVLHRLLLGDEVRIRGVHHLEQQIGAQHLLQRGAEGVDQVVGQLVDEAHRIGQDDLAVRLERDPPRGGIQGRERHVGHERVGIGQGVQERGLAGVRVAHQGHDRHLGPIPTTTGRRAVALDLGDLVAEPMDLLADPAPVGLELALARSPGADPAAGPRQVGPHPGQAREVVLELRELDLEPALAGPRVAGEDVQDQGAAVDAPCRRSASRGSAAGSGSARRRRRGR